jgi:hypothetical protein
MLNVGVLAVMSLGACLSQARLRNNYLSYPDVSRPMELLPQISTIAIKAYWLTYSVPLAWLVFSVFLLFWPNHKLEKRMDIVQLHTSATLLIGATILLFFVVAGMLPFIRISLGLSQ